MTGPTLPLKGKVIMVNPGHGGHLLMLDKNGKPTHYSKYKDPGAIGTYKGKQIKEADLNDEVATKLKKDLEAQGATVIFADNMDRIDINHLIAKKKPDAFISIHTDAKDPLHRFPDTGETVFSWGKSTDFGEKINKKLKADETIPNNPNIPEWAEQLAVLKVESVPSVLVEIGHINDKRELGNLLDTKYQETIAADITEGVEDYFNSKAPKTNTKSDSTSFSKYLHSEANNSFGVSKSSIFNQ